jgi:sterol desaturase/sphingolipid hydroxylase (fatty acid hydroxylase superfamily)
MGNLRNDAKNDRSSLSFHPVEAALFFSVYILPCFCGLPWGVWVAFKVGSVLGPLHAHCGHDLGDQLHGSVFHYRHHRYKRGNYGGYLPFDRWCGTELGEDGVPQQREGERLRAVAKEE